MHNSLPIIIPPIKDTIMLQKLQKLDQIIALEAIRVRFKSIRFYRTETVDEEFACCVSNVRIHTDVN